MKLFTVSEPHPTVPQGSYVHSGRGGAGNYFRAPETTPASGVAVQVPAGVASAPAPRRYYSGRGGAGNAHPMSDCPATLNLDEEYARAQHRDESGAGHVGRGGAGNFYKDATATTAEPAAPRKSFGSRRGSSESADSAHSSSLWARLSGSHLRH